MIDAVFDEASRCLLCHEAPCSAACPAGLDPASAVRSIVMKNCRGASDRLSRVDPKGDACATHCATKRMCEIACTRRSVDRPIRIGELVRRAHCGAAARADLSIDFLGVRCESPFFLASSPITGDGEMISRAFEAGWAGAVWKTIGFFVADECSPRFDAVIDGMSWRGLRNLEQISDKPTDLNFEMMARVKARFPDKVIVSSIMGRDADEWRRLAVMSEQAGADIIEGNFSCPQMTIEGAGADVGTSPDLVAEYTAAAAGAAKIPFIAKMTPNITDITKPAAAAMDAGAAGIAAINTIRSITSVDLDTMRVEPSVGGLSSISGYSGAAVRPIALRHAAELSMCDRVGIKKISGIGGITTWRDAAEFIALGCGNLQVCTAVMLYGYRVIDDLASGLSIFLGERGMSVGDLVGAALPSVSAPEMLDRKTIVKPIIDEGACVGCGRCRIACSDAGHDAIDWSADARRPSVSGRCVGCGLCSLVCPVGCVKMGERSPK